MTEEILSQVVEKLQRLDDFERGKAVVNLWLSVGGAAAYCMVSDDHIRRAIYAGDLTASNMGTPDRPLYRISRASMEEWLRSKQIGIKPAKKRAKKGEDSELANPFYK